MTDYELYDIYADEYSTILGSLKEIYNKALDNFVEKIGNYTIVSNGIEVVPMEDILVIKDELVR